MIEARPALPPIDVEAGAVHMLDLTIFGTSMITMLGIGFYFLCRNEGGEDYSVGGRKMRGIYLIGICILSAEGLWAAPPQVVVNASRVSGVAPLGVFLDASGSTDLTNNDFLQAHFSWDFGDSGSGVWEYTGRSANEATGFVAAHVYETPGTYTVTIGVLDVARQAGSATITITVLDPEDVSSGNHTRCVSRT